MATLVTKILCNLDVAKNPYISICETKGFDFMKEEKSPLKGVMIHGPKGPPVAFSMVANIVLRN